MKALKSIGCHLAALAIGALVPLAASHADILRQWRDGHWRLRAVANDQTKAFASCAASRDAQAGQEFMLVAGRDRGWTLVFIFPDAVKGAAESSAPIDLRLRHAQKLTFDGTMLSPTTLAISLPPDAPILDKMRRGRTLSYAMQDGHRGAVQLNGLRRLSGVLTQCVQAQLAAEKPGGDAASAQSDAPNDAASAQSGAPNDAASPQAAPQAATALELTKRIASNLLLNARLPKAHLVAASDTPLLLRGLGTAWISDTSMGSVLLVPSTSAMDEAHLGLATIMRGANTCKGEFAAGRSTNLIDRSMVTRTFTACSNADGARTMRYFIVRQDPGFYTMFTLVPTAGARAAPAARRSNGAQPASMTGKASPPQADDDFQAAAIKAAGTR